MDKRVLLYFNSKSQPSKIELWSGDRIVGDSLIGENQRITYHYVNGNKWFGQINRNLNYMKLTFPDDYDKNDFILKSNVNYDGLESLENDLRNDLVQLCTPFRQIVDLRKMTKHSFIFVHININQNSQICN